MALTFDFINSIIEVPSPTTSVSVQTLINEIRDAEDELNPAMTYPKIADAFGKQDLGGGSLVGITLVLLNDWRLRFQARPGRKRKSDSSICLHYRYHCAIILPYYCSAGFRHQPTLPC